VRRRLILRGPLTRQDLFTAEGWGLRLRGWLSGGCGRGMRSEANEELSSSAPLAQWEGLD
jgi:hypothetical protein